MSKNGGRYVPARAASVYIPRVGGDEVGAFKVERWVGGDKVDACVGEFSHLFKVIASHKRAALVHR